MEKKSLNQFADELKLKTPRQLFGTGAKFFVNWAFIEWYEFGKWRNGFESFELDPDLPIEDQIDGLKSRPNQTDTEEDYTVVYSNGNEVRLDWFMQPV